MQEIILEKEIIKALAYDLYDIVVQDVRDMREEEKEESKFYEKEKEVA